MACCLMAPSHLLNKGWLIISEVLWHSSDGNFTGNTQDIYLWLELKIINLRLQPHFPGDNEFMRKSFPSCLLSGSPWYESEVERRSEVQWLQRPGAASCNLRAAVKLQAAILAKPPSYNFVEAIQLDTFRGFQEDRTTAKVVPTRKSGHGYQSCAKVVPTRKSGHGYQSHGRRNLGSVSISHKTSCEVSKPWDW